MTSRFERAQTPHSGLCRMHSTLAIGLGPPHSVNAPSQARSRHPFTSPECGSRMRRTLSRKVAAIPCAMCDVVWLICSRMRTGFAVLQRSQERSQIFSQEVPGYLVDIQTDDGHKKTLGIVVVNPFAAHKPSTSRWMCSANRCRDTAHYSCAYMKRKLSCVICYLQALAFLSSLRYARISGWPASVA
jgi:hypothetical protein